MLKKEVYRHGIYWTGTAEALIERQICELGHLPVKSGNTIEREHFRVSRMSKKRFCVYKSNERILREREPAFEAYMNEVRACLS